MLRTAGWLNFLWLRALLRLAVGFSTRLMEETFSSLSKQGGSHSYMSQISGSNLWKWGHGFHRFGFLAERVILLRRWVLPSGQFRPPVKTEVIKHDVWKMPGRDEPRSDSEWMWSFQLNRTEVFLLTVLSNNVTNLETICNWCYYIFVMFSSWHFLSAS